MARLRILTNPAIPCTNPRKVQGSHGHIRVCESARSVQFRHATPPVQTIAGGRFPGSILQKLTKNRSKAAWLADELCFTLTVAPAHIAIKNDNQAYVAHGGYPPVLPVPVAPGAGIDSGNMIMVSAEAESDSGTAGYQRWSMLTFLHWRVAAGNLQPLLPAGLRIEQFDGSAWLGVVPFSMERVRPWWSPPVPGVSWFLETNVRTYVVNELGVAGVWFFSLDANSRFAVSLARTFWHLPYKLAAMTLSVNRNHDNAAPARITYSAVRKDPPVAGYGLTLDLPDAEPKPAQPGTLEHFLVERYLLFTTDRKQRLRTGRVHHDPYRIITPSSISGVQSLTAGIGCPDLQINSADHAVFCQGVDVRISPLKPVT